MLDDCCLRGLPANRSPPSFPPPLAVVLLNWTKASPQAFLPHLEALASQVRQLWEQGLIRAGEQNALQEAIVGAVTAGPPELQAQVVEWVLAGVRAEWASPAWQAHLASPQAFLQRYVTAVPDSAGGWQAGGQAERWILYHQTHLVERCFRSMRSVAAAAPGGQHPLASQAEWAVPQMLRVTACLHACYSPAGRAALAPIAAALEMSPQERTLYLRKGPSGKPAARVSRGAVGSWWLVWRQACHCCCCEAAL